MKNPMANLQCAAQAAGTQIQLAGKKAAAAVPVHNFGDLEQALLQLPDFGNVIAEVLKQIQQLINENPGIKVNRQLFDVQLAKFNDPNVSYEEKSEAFKQAKCLADQICEIDMKLFWRTMLPIFAYYGIRIGLVLL